MAHDQNLQALLEANTPVVTIFGKTWDLHVKVALGISLEENLELIRESVAFLKSQGREVIYDAEHFFDGYKADAAYALATLQAAEEAGADTIVLCDTNGGTMTADMSERFRAAAKHVQSALGNSHAQRLRDGGGQRHCRRATGRRAGAGHHQWVRRTVRECQPLLRHPQSRAEVGHALHRTGKPQASNGGVALRERVGQPASAPGFALTSGKSAFTHKGGIHVSAVMKEASAYEHVDPAVVGNERRVLVSELSGKSNVIYKAAELGLEIDKSSPDAKLVVDKLKEMEHYGYQFEGAEASFEMLFDKLLHHSKEFFDLDGFRVITEKKGRQRALLGGGHQAARGRHGRTHGRGRGGPGKRLGQGAEEIAHHFFPVHRHIRLTDYKVRVLDAKAATDAKVRVLIETTDGHETWGTVGVSENLIEASWQALVDSIAYKLKKEYGYKR